MYVRIYVCLYVCMYGNGGDQIGGTEGTLYVCMCVCMAEAATRLEILVFRMTHCETGRRGGACGQLRKLHAVIVVGARPTLM